MKECNEIRESIELKPVQRVEEMGRKKSELGFYDKDKNLKYTRDNRNHSMYN